MLLPRIIRGLTFVILVVPLVCGLVGTALPAFGYLPTLGGDHLTLHFFADLFARPGIGRSILLTFATAFMTTALSFLVVIVFVAGWAGTHAFARLQHLVSPLLALPHAAAAFGLAFLIAPSGFLLRLVSPWLTGFDRPPGWLIVHDPLGLAMVTGLVVKEVPFLLLVTFAALPQLRLEQTRRLAASFGYGRIAGFSYLLAPPLYGQIRLAVYAVLAYASSVVDVSAILGPTLPATLPVRLLQWMNDPDLALRFVASAGALVQLVLTLSALALWWAAECGAGRLARFVCAGGARFRRDAWLRSLSLGLVTLSAFFIFAGMAILALWSVAGLWQFPNALPNELTMRNWARHLPQITTPLITTVYVALISTTLAVLLTLGCLEREVVWGRRAGHMVLTLIYLPLIVPQISFIFGLQVLTIITGTEASLVALVLVHLIFVLPYVFLSLSDPWRAYDRRYELIAAALGVPRWRVLMRVRLPMLLRAILTAAAVGFAVSVGQYLPTVLIGAGRLTTITTEAVALASGGDGRVIGIYAFLQALLPFLGFAIASLAPALLFRHRGALRV
jgi:putative thiamine transport system permease protein